MVNGIRKAAFACEKYVSGKSMDDVMRDYGLSSVVKLGSNENMYGPYPHALEAMRDEVSLINIYPERNYIKLKELLADKFGVADSTWVSLGHGAGNVLDSIAKTLLEEGDEVLVPAQSYRLYPEISKIMGAKVIEVPLNDQYSIDLHDYAKLLTDRTKIVWLCNPNNPTGTVVPIDDFAWFVDQMPADCWLVVDEAYAEFADADVLPDVIAAVKSGKQVIDVSGVKTHKDSGKLLLVTVNASGVPGYPVTNAQALLAWANPKATVIPQEAVFPVGQSAKDYAKESNKEMSSSQSAAATAAKRFLKAHGYDVSGMKVSMHVDDIGGPSAGMMYTLGLIDKVTGEQLSGGKTIAGTGTMNAKGKVGAIGGIRLKMIGAKRDGATWFLAPESNCSDVVGHVPQGLHVVKVGTLDEAYDALVAIRDGKGGSLPQCTVKQ